MVLSQLCAGGDWSYVVLAVLYAAVALLWWHGCRWGSREANPNKNDTVDTSGMEQTYRGIILEKNDEIEKLKREYKRLLIRGER